mmetsp:Transcript_34475/g.81248  ORF Transcript_34475/g.81248 Transcript_34475/m.81248 type:complete len:211 (+) Transcript_34475:129-761(+)
MWTRTVWVKRQMKEPCTASRVSAETIVWTECPCAMPRKKLRDAQYVADGAVFHAARGAEVADEALARVHRHPQPHLQPRRQPVLLPLCRHRLDLVNLSPGSMARSQRVVFSLTRPKRHDLVPDKVADGAAKLFDDGAARGVVELHHEYNLGRGQALHYAFEPLDVGVKDRRELLLHPQRACGLALSWLVRGDTSQYVLRYIAVKHLEAVD